MLLKLANIGLPSEIIHVDGLNEQVHLVRRHMVVVRVAPLIVGLFMLTELRHFLLLLDVILQLNQ